MIWENLILLAGIVVLIFWLAKEILERRKK